MTALAATTLAPGQANAAPVVLAEPLSFCGGLDAATGRVIDRWHPQHGLFIAGGILVMESGRGSSGGGPVLAEAIRLGVAPVGIVLMRPDPILTVGALVAGQLYGHHCPIVLADARDWPRITMAKRLVLDAEADAARIELFDA